MKLQLHCYRGDWYLFRAKFRHDSNFLVREKKTKSFTTLTFQSLSECINVDDTDQNMTSKVLVQEKE